MLCPPSLSLGDCNHYLHPTLMGDGDAPAGCVPVLLRANPDAHAGRSPVRPQTPTLGSLPVPHWGYFFPWSHSGGRMFSTVWAGSCCHVVTSGNTKPGFNHCSVTVTSIFILMTVASDPGRFYFHLHMKSLVYRCKCLILCISVMLME